MKLWSVPEPCAIKRIRSLAGIGLVVLAVVPSSHVLAEPAKPTVAQEKIDAEKDAKDKAAAEKEAKDKAAAEKEAKDKAAAEKEAKDKAAAEKEAKDKAAAKDVQAKLVAAASAKGAASAKAIPAMPAECLRTGQRVIAALARDDTGAANQFFAFYNAFKCPQPYLAQAFGCLVNVQAANPVITNPSPELVNQCWNDPATPPKVPQPPSPPQAEPPH